MPVTINNGYEMPAWFDIYGWSLSAKIDVAGISQSVSMVEKLITNEIAKGISSDRIILAGFSQGAVIAMTTGLCYSKRLAGIMALSGYLPLAENLLKRASKVNHQTPIFVAHGTEDVVLPYALGVSTADVLKKAGYPVAWHNYSMAHTVCAEEVKDINDWIISVLNTVPHERLL
jgi:phospholipase/carboxylesterase